MLPAAKDQPAYVLHRRAFRETSAIVELLTRGLSVASQPWSGASRAAVDGE